MRWVSPLPARMFSKLVITDNTCQVKHFFFFLKKDERNSHLVFRFVFGFKAFSFFLFVACEVVSRLLRWGSVASLRGVPRAGAAPHGRGANGHYFLK